MSRITAPITYNLKDRKRLHTGEDRPEYQVPYLVAHINSPAVQEFVKKGDLYGYCGHQIRQLYGMQPPETVIINGKEIRIEPAIRTIALSADEDGNVTHQVEFLETEAGEFAYNQYKAKIGGFSTAVDYMPINGVELPVEFFGFDYVRSPNYANNTSYGVFDSISESIKPVVKQMLENEIAHIYDDIHTSNQTSAVISDLASRSMKAEQEVERLQRRQKRIDERRLELRHQKYDSALCPTVPFEKFLSESSEFVSRLKDSDAVSSEKVQEEEHISTGFAKLLGGA